MITVLALALLLGSSHEGGFPARVTQAKLIEAGTAGTAYQKVLWGQIGNPTTDAYRSCLASNAPADTTPFTLVADAGADGKPSHVEVMPATPVAKCMAGQFTTWTLPKPPADPSPYPIEIDYSIAK
jgi:hypothetical protein